jgi:predicted kinase
MMQTPDGYRGIVFILKGVPGSGKSNLALRLVDGDKTHVFSTDDWFESQPGGYKANWKIDKLYGAHRWNQERVRAAMQKGITPLAVDNTNLRAKEARPYIEMSNQYQYFPIIKDSDSPWWKEVLELLKNKSINSEELKKWAEKLSGGFEHEGKMIKNVHEVPTDVIHRMLMAYNPYTVDDVQYRIKLGPE